MSNKEHLKEAQGVNSVTDYVEDKEVVDASKAQNSVSSLTVASTTAGSPAIIRNSQEDIIALVDELEVTKDVADSMLRKNGGSLKRTLQSFVDYVR